MIDNEKLPAKLFLIEKEHDLDRAIAQGINWPHINPKMTKKDLESSNRIIKIDWLGFAPSDPTPVEMDGAAEFFVLKKFKDQESGMTFIYAWPATPELREG